MNKPKTIRRAKHGESARFFLMARSTAQDKQLSWEAIGVMAYLLSKPDDWTIQPTDLQTEHCGRDKVYRILRELIAAGYLVREKRRNDKGRIEWGEYILYELPQTEKPHTEKPDTENQDMVTGEVPYTEKPYTEKPHTTDNRITRNRKTHSTEARKRDNGLKSISQRWNEDPAVADIGNTLLRLFGWDGTVDIDHMPTSAVEPFFEAAMEMNRAGMTPADAEKLHAYVIARAKKENWTFKPSVGTLAKYFIPWRSYQTKRDAGQPIPFAERVFPGDEIMRAVA